MSRPSNLSDSRLLREVRALAASQHRLTADLVLHLAEMDTRRLYAAEGFPSLFSYCVGALAFSEDEACRRIEAARLARGFPALFELLASGAVTLSVLGLLKPYLTPHNHEELVAGVSGASVRRAKEWLATRFPRPDVPWSIRKSPVLRAFRGMSDASGPLAQPAPDGGRTAPADSASEAPDGRDAAEPRANGVPAIASRPSGMQAALSVSADSQPRVSRARVEPISLDRFLVKLTVSRALKDKLELARDLTSHANPNGDLAIVIERALDLLISKIQKRKFGLTVHSDGKRRPAKRTHVARSTRREVVARDGLCCSFVAPDGRRCEAQAFLEFDHVEPRGRGGGSGPDNVRLLCRAHNLLAAERTYGQGHVRRAIATARAERDERSAVCPEDATPTPGHSEKR